MPPNNQEPSRLELYKAGKIEERRSVRPPHVAEKEEAAIEETVAGFKLRPELIAIGLMILLLIILALAGL